MRVGIAIVMVIFTLRIYAQESGYEEDLLKEHPLDSNDLPMSTDSSSDYFHKTYVSLYAGLAPVVADSSQNYSIGLTFGFNILYMPVKYVGIGISPNFYFWKKKSLPPVLEKSMLYDIALGGIIRINFPITNNVGPYIQAGPSGHMRILYERDTSSVYGSQYYNRFYAGFMSKIGMQIKTFEFGIGFEFVSKKEKEFFVPWMTICVGFRAF
ncbi:MAG: hypothetical protein L0Y76_06375 [Ignavibacteria bacterium]|nr:hypothetical protein [Ignavibacteria bacterium]